MKFNTSRFGEIEVDDDKIISMTEGLLGFQNIRRYVILDHAPDSPLKWLQAVDEPELAFIIMDPLFFKPDYRVHVSAGDLSDLMLDKAENAAVCVIITIPGDHPSEMTANLMGPIVINAEKRLAKQIVLYDGPYSTKHNIIEEMTKDQPVSRQQATAA